MSATRALLEEIVDDAGLFPPAALDMDDAVDAHLRARSGAFAWMLGRFVCPFDKLDVLRRFVPRNEKAIRLSIIAPPGWSATAFENVADDKWRLEAIEARLPDADVARWTNELQEAGKTLGATNLWLEIPWSDYPTERWPDATDALARSTAVGLKIRCGGEQPDAIPPPGVLAAVIVACRDAGVRFKATAGLHHPFRHGGHHGFVNLAMAVTLARVHKLDAPDVAEILAADHDEAFVVRDDLVGWRDLTANEGDVIRARAESFAGFGSCSFREPVDDLVALGILDAA
jgi:hypothetical protein